MVVKVADVPNLSHEELVSAAKAEAWYHTIDFGEFVVDGEFDLRPFLDRYGFPDDLTGKRVLDVGRSSGFLAFELERRGATVVATELPTTYDKDYVGGPIVSGLIREWVEEEYRKAGVMPDESVGERVDFFLARRLLGSKVEPIYARMVDLTPERVGTFDLVFAGSVLNHSRDPFLALQHLFSVTKEGGSCIVANPIFEDDSAEPRFDMPGLKATGLTTWLVPNRAALCMMVEAAGYLSVEITNPQLDLTLRSKNIIRHAVVKGLRGSRQETRAKFASLLERKHKGISGLA